MRRIFSWAALGLLASACAGTQRSVAFEDLSDADLAAQVGQLDLTELALLVSGFEKTVELRAARAQFEAMSAPILERLAGIEGEELKARNLLAELHHTEGFLQHYNARATTLKDVLERRTFNCLSASILFNILAERIGLSVEAQLLPTHARSLVKVKRDGGEALVIVETTSPLGFDPSAEAQASILAQVAAAPTRGERSLVPADGARVTNLILVGAMFVNRASIAQESGDLALAERLFARGESFAVGETMRSLLRDQRAALLSQLGADDILSNDPQRLPRAHQTLRAAARLDPKDEQIRANVLQNLRAAAERIIARDADAQDETGVLGVLAEVTELGIGLDDRSGLKAFAMSEISRLRAAKGDLDGAVAAIELALNEQLAPRDAPLKGTLEQNHIAALRLAAMSSAKRGEYDKSIKLIERLLSIPTLTGQQKRDCDADRLRAIQWAGQKQMEQQNHQAAAEIYRQGVRLFPENAALRQNLVAALERTLMPKVERGECTALTDPIDELRTLDKDSTFPEKALVRCLTVRANELLKNGSDLEAITILRMALKESPKNPLVARNLGLALFQGAQRMVAAGNCKKANELAKELRNVDTSALGAEDLDHALAPCRGK